MLILNKGIFMKISVNPTTRIKELEKLVTSIIVDKKVLPEYHYVTFARHSMLFPDFQEKFQKVNQKFEIGSLYPKQYFSMLPIRENNTIRALTNLNYPFGLTKKDLKFIFTDLLKLSDVVKSTKLILDLSNFHKDAKKIWNYIKEVFSKIMLKDKQLKQILVVYFPVQTK